MALTVSIAGVDRTSLVQGDGPVEHLVQISMGLGQKWTCQFPIVDDTDSTIPALGAAVLVAQGSTELFYGHIKKVENEPATGTAGGYKTVVTASSIADVVDRIRGTNDNWSTNPTIKAVCQWIVTTYLSAYGIALDAGMATGPNVGNLTMTGWTVRAMLDHLCLIADGWFWRINPDSGGPGGELQVFAVGTEVAANSWTTANARALGPVRWSRSREQYYNRIRLTYGPTAAVPKQWSVTGNGSTDDWELEYAGALAPDGIHLLCGFVTDSALSADLPVGSDPSDTSAYYDYQPSTNRMIRKAGNLPNGATATMSYQAQFPQEIIVEDAGLIATDDVYEGEFRREDIIDLDIATVEAEALLRRYSSTPKVITVMSFDFELPGTVVPLDFSNRSVASDDYLILNVRSVGHYNGEVLWAYECAEGTEAFATWRATLKQALGGGGSGAVQSGQSTSGATSIVRTVPRLDGRFADEVISFNGVSGKQVRLNYFVTGINGGAGPGLMLGRGPEIENSTWQIHATIQGFYGAGGTGGRGRLSFTYAYDDTFGHGMGLHRQATSQYVLLPHPFSGSGSSSDAGTFLGDPFSIAEVDSGRRTWAGIRVFTSQLRDGIFERDRTTRLGDWLAYTPAWTASTSNPSLGNGVLTGRYTLIGKTVCFEVYLRLGSTTTLGTGTWLFSLPQTGHADYAGSNRFPISMPSMLRDDSAASHYQANAQFSTATTVYVEAFNGGTGGALTGAGTVPFTWTTDDRLMITGRYEMA